MPYIKEEKRNRLDPIIDQLIDELAKLQLDDPTDNPQGNVNYIFTRILDKMYSANYQEVNNAVGILSCVALEYYRRMAAPIEDQKIYENGDVYENSKHMK